MFTEEESQSIKASIDRHDHILSLSANTAIRHKDIQIQSLRREMIWETGDFQHRCSSAAAVVVDSVG